MGSQTEAGQNEATEDSDVAEEHTGAYIHALFLANLHALDNKTDSSQLRIHQEIRNCYIL